MTRLAERNPAGGARLPARRSCRKTSLAETIAPAKENDHPSHCGTETIGNSKLELGDGLVLLKLLVVPALAVGWVAAAGFLSASFANGRAFAGPFARDGIRTVVGKPGLHDGQSERQAEEEIFHG